jgi:predicted dehydrogenase
VTRARVGILGCGVISRAYAAKLAAAPDVEVVACADLVPERARELAAKHGVPLALEPEKLVRHPDVDVVLNLTIPAVHAELAQAALDAGKSVYGEKPLALELA